MAGKSTGSKSARKLNKSREIISYYTANPDAKPREIVSALKRRGVEINAQYVSTILFNHRQKIRNNGIDFGNGSRRNRAIEGSINGVTAHEIILAKQLVQQAGSIKAARRALDIYNDIVV